MNNKKRTEIIATITSLAERFPRTFAVYEARRVPLQVGIYDDILTRLAGAPPPRKLNLALMIYCGSAGYLRSCRAGVERIDLDGIAAGIVTAGEAEHAATRLAAKRKRLAAAEPAAPPQSPPPPPPPPPKRLLTLADLRHAAELRKAQQGAGRQ